MNKANTQQQDNHDKIQAEIVRLSADTSKLNSWHRVFLFVGAVYALAIVSIFEILQ